MKWEGLKVSLITAAIQKATLDDALAHVFVMTWAARRPTTLAAQSR
jgi:hypothetical protein